jgi:hypothetical protein
MPIEAANLQSVTALAFANAVQRGRGAGVKCYPAAFGDSRPGRAVMANLSTNS